MTQENKQLDFFQHRLKFEREQVNPILEQIYSDRPLPMAEQERLADERLKKQLAEAKLKHPDKHPKKSPTYEEMRNEKKYFPQIITLEGNGGLHEIMQRRFTHKPDPLDDLVAQELKDQSVFDRRPKKSGYRLKEDPTIRLNKNAFSDFSKDLISLSEEDGGNLQVSTAERYDRRQYSKRKRNNTNPA